MHFKNDKHEMHFVNLCAKANCGDNKEYRAALYCLAATEKPVVKYVDGYGISFRKLLKECEKWSSGERALIKLGANLFNPTWEVSVSDTFESLDKENFQVALQALQIRY